MKIYIAVLDEFPDYMTPTLVAHKLEALGTLLEQMRVLSGAELPVEYD